MRKTVHVDSMADIQLGLKDLNARWREIREEALTGALLHGGFTEAVMDRTPQSLTDRYRYADGRKNNRYGMARLLKSMFYNPTNPDSPTFYIQRRMDSCSVIFGPSASADVPYAKAMHESKTPYGMNSHRIEVKIMGADGKERTVTKWTKGWSKKDTGPKYIAKPWDDNRFETEKQLIRNIDAELEKVGLI